MSTVNHLKESNLQPSQRKPSPFWSKSLIPPVLLVSLLGTYLDLFFVGNGLYAFPKRPFPEIFSVNIAFTLVGLPCLTIGFLFICEKVNSWWKLGFILLMSLLMSVIEKLSEAFGFFAHHDSWQHLYTFFGYFFFLTLIYLCYYYSKN